MNCCRKKRKRTKSTSSEIRSENEESSHEALSEETKDTDSDAKRAVIEMHKLVHSNGKTGRMRFGAGLPVWVKIVKSGTNRPEVTMLVNGTPRRFRARCLPVGAGTLEECDELERTAALPPTCFDLVVPSKMNNSMLLVHLLGVDEHMNVCFRLQKPWDQV